MGFKTAAFSERWDSSSNSRNTYKKGRSFEHIERFCRSVGQCDRQRELTTVHVVSVNSYPILHTSELATHDMLTIRSGIFRCKLVSL